MDTLRQDVRYALRQLARNPGFTVVALAILATGIGANTAIFSVLNSVLIRPLPFDRSEQLVQIWETKPEVVAARNLGYSDFGVNVLNFDEYRARSTTVAEMGFVTEYDDDGKIQVGGVNAVPEDVWAWGVSSSLFATLGVQPFLGRVFLEEERAPPGEYRWTDVAILSYRLWQRRFGADPGIVGKTIMLDAGPSTVVGVMPEGFDLPPILRSGTILYRHADVYLPLYYQAYQQPRRFHQMRVFGRLAPGVTLEAAQAEMTLLAHGLAEAYPADMAGWTVVVRPLRAIVAARFGGGLYLLMGVVGLVLVIGCGNVASLLLVRGAARSSEIAVRLAIGSGRARLLRLLLTETTVLVVLGGGAGVLLALGGTRLLVNLLPASVPRASDTSLDARVLGFALALSLLTGLLCGLLPALRASASNPIDGLKSGMTGRSGARGPRLGSQLLVGGQVAAALVLLIGAGLLVKSFLRLRADDPGYEARGVLVAELSFGAHDQLTSFSGSGSETPDMRMERTRRQFRFVYQVVERIERLPGVESAASGDPKPMSGSLGFWPLTVEGRPDEEHWTLATNVTPDYLQTMRIPLLYGEALPRWDGMNDWERYTWNGGCTASHEHCVVIVSETLARTLWPGESAIGKRIGIYQCCLTITGVAADATYRGIDDAPLARDFDTRFHLYLPFPGYTVFVRSSGDPNVLAGPVRRVIEGLAPMAVVKLSTLDDDLAASLARPRSFMVLLSMFACTAMALAMVGLYGVMAFTVAQRTREIGLRMALGAARIDMLWMVVRQGAGPLTAGILVGLTAAAMLTRALVGLLYGLEPLDPLVFAVLAATLGSVGLLATYFPARRASRIAPMKALRYE